MIIKEGLREKFDELRSRLDALRGYL